MAAICSSVASDGVPPPTKTVWSVVPAAHGRPATRSISPHSAERNRSIAPGSYGAVLNEQYPHRSAQNGK